MNLSLYDGEHQERCNVCFERGLLLCCDYCYLSYHPQCVLPVIEAQPEDYWTCPQCEKDLLDEMGEEVIQERCREYHRSLSTTMSSLDMDVEQDIELNPMNSGKNEYTKGENGNKKGHIFTSGFRGVYSRGDKWNAQIQYNGKKVYLGSYSSEEEAARAYDIAAKRYHGNKAILNFHNHESGSVRNPFQVNSKPTFRKESHLLSNSSFDFAEGEEEVVLSSHNSQKQSLQEEDCTLMESFNGELPFPLDFSPICFVDEERSKQLIEINRNEINSYL